MTTYQTQCLLGYLGYLPEMSQDGISGPKTKAATSAFQADYGLAVDGVAGEMTNKMLVAAVAGTAVKMEKPEAAEDTDQPQTGTWWDDIKYFHRDDDGIRCPCPRCGGWPVEPTEKLMRTADSIREELGPMIPSSTVRCQAHNDELPGSAKNSRHLSGRAMDFSAPYSSQAKIESCLEGRKNAGEIRYWYSMGSGWYHFDVD